jgi:hypothetical protein
VNAKYARFFGPVLLGMVMIVALCALIPFLASLLHEGRWEPGWGWGVYVLASFTLAWMIPVVLPKRKGDWRARQYRWPEWSLFSYFFLAGLGLNWACVVSLSSGQSVFHLKTGERSHVEVWHSHFDLNGFTGCVSLARYDLRSW